LDVDVAAAQIPPAAFWCAWRPLKKDVFTSMLDTVVFGIVALHVAVAEVVGVDGEEVGLLLC
jgi:hypothetical protein